MLLSSRKVRRRREEEGERDGSEDSFLCDLVELGETRREGGDELRGR